MRLIEDFITEAEEQALVDEIDAMYTGRAPKITTDRLRALAERFAREGVVNRRVPDRPFIHRYVESPKGSIPVRIGQVNPLYVGGIARHHDDRQGICGTLNLLGRCTFKTWSSCDRTDARCERAICAHAPVEVMLPPRSALLGWNASQFHEVADIDHRRISLVWASGRSRQSGERT